MFVVEGVTIPNSDTCVVCSGPIDSRRGGGRDPEQGVPYHIDIIEDEATAMAFEQNRSCFGGICMAHLRCAPIGRAEEDKFDG